jgi:ATP phosphoribosyltransferase
VAVSAMVLRKNVSNAMDELTAIGATDILVTKIENSRTI